MPPIVLLSQNPRLIARAITELLGPTAAATSPKTSPSSTPRSKTMEKELTKAQKQAKKRQLWRATQKGTDPRKFGARHFRGEVLRALRALRGVGPIRRVTDPARVGGI